MNPTDLADVSGATYTYLMNGQPPAGNWTGLFTPGERVRLRLINGSAMSYFDVRIPGVKLTVVAADGLPVRPVTVDELRIAVAETYDVIVEPTGAEAFTIVAQAMDRTGFAAGTLAVRAGLRAEVPGARSAPGADDGRHGPRRTTTGPHDAGAHAGHGAAPQDPHAGHAGRRHATHPRSESRQPARRHADDGAARPSWTIPASGCADNGRRVLTYADLSSVFDDPDGREPSRTIELHLTGHMERFAWSFDGVQFADAAPLRLTYGERVRLVLVNDTMMTHPIHLHGMWSDLEDEQGRFKVRKHTIDMPPGTRRAYRVTADALGRWAYHCHLLFHMEAGMFREVRVEEGGRS